MLTVLIVIIGCAIGIDNLLKGDWTSVLITAGVTLVLLGLISEDKRNVRAYMNFRDYWAEGGDRK